MPLDLSDVREASYKQARFLLENSTVAGGRKDVLHEYVNSNKQVIEDLGLKRKVFTVSAIIHGEFYEERKRILIAALEDPEVGTLIHPFFGAIERVKCRNYTITENFSEFGVAKVQIVFGVSDEIAAPQKAQQSITEIVRNRDEVLDSSVQNFIDNFFTDPAVPESVGAAKEKSQSFIDKFKDVVNSTGKVTDEINELNGKIQGFASEIGSLVQEPQRLADSINDLFFTLTTVYPGTLQTLKTLDGMFDFGSDDSEQLEIETVAVQTVNKNNNSFNTNINTTALAHAYVALAQVDTSVDTDAVDDGESDNPQTIEEIEFQEARLEEQFQTIIDNGLANGSLDQSTQNNLIEERGVFGNVIEEIKTQVPNVIEVEVSGFIPLRVLGFNYYGQTENFTLLRSINDDPNVSFYDNEVNLLNDNA